MNNKGTLECFFCGFKAIELELMIEGPRANICINCVDLCTDIVAEERSRKAHDRWEKVSITSLEEAVKLIRACGEATELRYLLDRIDKEVCAKNLVLEDKLTSK